MFKPPPPSYSASMPEVISADARQKWQGSQLGRRSWLASGIVIVIVLALLAYVFLVLLK